MRHFIFVTHEGLTKTPKLEDIENLQVLGFEKGATKEEAFQNFVAENSHLADTGFNEVTAFELTRETQHYFSLQKQEDPGELT